MGTSSIVYEGEVFLNEKKYKLMLEGDQPGRVRMELLPQFPQKQIIGDAEYDNELYISKWILNDFRDGMGQEEFDPEHPHRTYWHSCNVDHEGHCTLPPLVSSATLPTIPNISNGDMDSWGDISSVTTWVVVSGTNNGGAFKVSGAEAYQGISYACKLVGGNIAGQTSTISQSFTNDGDISGRPFSVVAYCDQVSGVGSAATMILADNISQTAYAITGSEYAKFSVTRIMDVSATSMSVKFTTTYGTSLYIDSVDVGSLGSVMGPCREFNGNLYFSWDRCLIKMDTSGAFTTEGIFPDTITALISALTGPHLAVFLGDDDAYWYRDISGTWATPTNAVSESGRATYGVEWQSKLWKMDSDGTIASCSSPFNASPDWTDNGKLSLPDNYVKGLLVDRDASGNDIIYAYSRVGLHAHDTTNARFLDTICKVPDHANNGKACVSWQGFIWYSAGLRVLKYRAGDTAILEDAGRDQRDGPPAWIGSSHYINAFVPGQFWMYVLCSGSDESVMKINRDGSWHVVHASTSGAKHSGIISSVYGNRFWFNNNNALYWIAEPTSNVRPGKVTGSEYATGLDAYDGEIYLPRFDGGSKSESKLALSIGVVCSAMGVANEIVMPYYRINQLTGAELALPGASQWTNLTDISGIGLTSRSLGTDGVGVPFRTIDIALALVSTPYSPDVNEITLRYIKSQSMKWGYGMTFDCRETYGGQTPLQQEANLKAAAESQTLIPFAFRDAKRDADTPHYVKIIPPMRAKLQGGQPVGGVYEVNVFEP